MVIKPLCDEGGFHSKIAAKKIFELHKKWIRSMRQFAREWNRFFIAWMYMLSFDAVRLFKNETGNCR
jgi:hypothetical protein